MVEIKVTNGVVTSNFDSKTSLSGFVFTFHVLYPSSLRLFNAVTLRRSGKRVTFEVRAEMHKELLYTSRCPPDATRPCWAQHPWK